MAGARGGGNYITSVRRRLPGTRVVAVCLGCALLVAMYLANEGIKRRLPGAAMPAGAREPHEGAPRAHAAAVQGRERAAPVMPAADDDYAPAPPPAPPPPPAGAAAPGAARPRPAARAESNSPVRSPPVTLTLDLPDEFLHRPEYATRGST